MRSEIKEYKKQLKDQKYRIMVLKHSVEDAISMVKRIDEASCNIAGHPDILLKRTYFLDNLLFLLNEASERVKMLVINTDMEMAEPLQAMIE